MDFDSELKAIFNMLHAFLSSLGITQKPKSGQVSKKRHIREGGFRSPLHSSWTNLGAFLPGTYINETHKDGHYGIDMQAPAGTSVYSFGPGTVLNAGASPGNSAGGITVSILHRGGLMTYYAHLNSIAVSKGDEVDSSTIIGTVGNTGNAKNTASHLHFEVHSGVNPKSPSANWNGTAVDPSSYMAVPQYGKKQSPKRMA